MATQANLNLTQQLYVAYYGRPADKEGLNYWADRIEAEGVGNVVSAFGSSSEFQEQYGDLDNDELVVNIYQQLFSRAPEVSGLQYWTGVLDSGEKSLADIALSISNAASGSDKTVLKTKIEAADYYTDNVEQGQYNLNVAKQVLKTIDETDTNGDLANARDTIDSSIKQSSSVADLEAREAAQEALTEAETALSEKAVELGITDVDTDGSFMDDAEAAVATAQGALASDRASAGTDSKLQNAVAEAKLEVQADTAANALLKERNATAAELEANVSANGETADLASTLDDNLALYLNNNTNADLSTLKTATETYLGSAQDDAAESAFLDAVAAAEDAIFTGTGTDKVSTLEDGATGDSIESIVTNLDERNTLFDDAADAQTALNGNVKGADLITAETALENRNDLKEAITEAEANVATLKPLEDARDEAQKAFDDADAAFGFTIEAVDGALEDGAGDETLFQYDADAETPVANGSIANFGVDDLLQILSENNYSLGKITEETDEDGNVTASFLDGNNGAFEVFFQEANGGADTDVVIETKAFGSSSGDTQTVSLVGVTVDQLNFDNGVISSVEIA
nr:DUF4214 domain-containing protein [uncultured Halomonas sp.]